MVVAKRRSGASAKNGKAPKSTRELAPSTEELVGLFFGVLHRMKEHFSNRAAEFDLSFPQAMAVRELEQPLSMRELADRLHCDASNVTGIVDRLEERGLVERHTSPGDRRVKRLVLTEEGRALRDAHHHRLTDGLPLVSALGADDRRQLADILRRVANYPLPEELADPA